MACSYPYIENVLLKGQRRRGQVCLATTHHFWTKPIERVSRGITCLEEDQEPLKRIANTKENVTIGTANNRTTNRPDPQGGKCHWFFHKTITTKTIIVFVGIGLQTKRNELNSTRLDEKGGRSLIKPLYTWRQWHDYEATLIITQKNNFVIKNVSTYLPTKFSNTELLPADWPPTTAICGRSNCMWTPSWVNASCSLLTIGISVSMMMTRWL